ncbi:AMP-binding protein [Quisquiliibacterium transsilvanicum]|uniref:Acyl-CoA synthetase (AMP-forming)/AMP-acid ligase II n=1 Tax=Quisquiliibacterium transsilvanicum TaxID=1549638 RepID=A0A7W8HH91_9BURK|nr:AMP-binding protein [Quisquiliibacterium transsilvanicum]MBB5271970.1 acyl-CoA synthetase (AMP-forming)/AMP-acid ligase II [Quisquiliibacterium transsilvanicum]
MAQRGLSGMLVGNILATAALRHPDRESYFCSGTGRRFTFRQTNERVNRLANALTALGLVKGDVVAFLSTNRVEVVEIYFALAKTGIVGLPLNYRLAPVEMVELATSMGATGILIEQGHDEAAAQLRRDAPGILHTVVIGDDEPAHGLGYERLLAGSHEAEPQVEIGEGDPFYFNLTSGTTGLPKSYVMTQYNMSTMFPMFHAHGLTEKDVALTVFPMFGRVGFGWAMATAMYGVRNVLANFEPAAVLRLIETERVSIVNLVATMSAMLLSCDRLAATDLSSLRGTTFVGSALPERIRNETIQRICPNLYEYYGMQETGALAVSTPEDRARRPDSVGRAILFAEVRVVDDAGRPLPAGELGEVIGRSPNSVTAYWQNPEKSAETFRDGWIHTGDLGRIDDEGYLFISGRKKDMIITGGQNVHASEVEGAVLGCEGVADCAVIGLPDDFWGERVAAVVVAAEGAAVDGDAVIRACRSHLAGFKTPKEIIVQSEPLPRTPTGKVQKFLLVERYAKKS